MQPLQLHRRRSKRCNELHQSPLLHRLIADKGNVRDPVARIRGAQVEPYQMSTLIRCVPDSLGRKESASAYPLLKSAQECSRRHTPLTSERSIADALLL